MIVTLFGLPFMSQSEGIWALVGVVLMLLVGLVLVATAVSVFLGKDWAWDLMTVVYAIQAGMTGLDLIIGPRSFYGVFLLVLFGGIAWYSVQRADRLSFDRGSIPLPGN